MKIEEIFRWKAQNPKEHTEISLICLDTHGSLSQLEENKCMRTRSKDGTMCAHTYSLLIEKDLYECQNISVNFLCVYLYL